MFDGDLEEKLEMFKLFIADSRELLDDVEPKIIKMEEKALAAGEIDKDILNAIFRLFHSLKGSASFLDLQTIISVTHEAETLLDIFRNQKTVINPGHVDLLIRSSDFIRNILDTVEQQLSDKGFEGEAARIVTDLQKTIFHVESETGAGPSPDLDGRNQEDYGRDPADQGRTEPPGAYAPYAGLKEMGLSTTPEMTWRFVEESGALLDEAEKMLLALEKAPQDKECADSAFRALQSFKDNAGFFGFAGLEDLSHHAETLLDKIRGDKKPGDSVAVSFLLIAIDALRDGVGRVEAGMEVNLPGKEEICRRLKDLAATAEDGAEGHQPEARNPFNASDTAAQTLQSPEHIEPLDSGAKQERWSNGFVEQPEEIPRTAQQPTGEPGDGDGGEAKQQQAIRVDLDKLDKLLDLVGEMVIAEAMVSNNPDLRGLQLGRFEKAVLQLDKITRDIQEIAMSMRMIPLSGAFRRMVRLVRDLAQKAGKRVSLQISGEETEVDKTIIEQINDPLVHLIRNAVDHGLEKPAERLAAGKPETGQISIEAKHSVGEVWIIIEDDGRGLDREKILKKGIERGLVRDENQDLKDEEVWRMIFEPGFSTAEKISSISGRGVGMDVVKRNIEKLRGKVDVRSKPGAGTMFAVRIPLTLAIIEGMVVKVGQNRYTIPINSIKESLKPGAGQITRTPDNLEVVGIRGELLPVIRLHEFYNVQTDRQVITDGILIVVENDVSKCCLFVDEVIGQQQIVIKGLSNYLGHVRSVSGCAILGDGDISMILDIDDLINTVQAENMQ